MRKIKLCLVGNASSPHLKKIINLFSSDQKYEVYVISSTRADGKRVFFDRDYLPFFLQIKFLRFLGRFFLFRRLLAEIKPDILHVHELNAFGLAAGLTGFQPLVVSVWGSDIRLRNPIKDVLKRRVLSKAKSVMATSHFLKKETDKFFGQEVVTTITPFGVDTERFSPRQKRQTDIITLGFAKQLKEFYGPDLLLSAFINLKNDFKNLRLVFAGEGNLKEKLMFESKSKKVDQDVTFLGKIEEEEVVKTLQNLDIFIMPTKVPEAFGVAALEAEAVGIPVVATKIGGIPEVVQDKKTGLLFEANNQKELEEKITDLLKDQDLRARLGVLGREFVSKKFSLTQMKRNFETVYVNLNKDFSPLEVSGKT